MEEVLYSKASLIKLPGLLYCYWRTPALFDSMIEFGLESASLVLVGGPSSTVPDCYAGCRIELG